MPVEMAKSAARKLRFGAFEVDLRNRELRKSGLRLKLQQKPFQILEALLETPGALILRADLAQRLWPDLHVNFDRSLNTAVNALRQALADSPRNPRFIETRPGLGYRFLASVEEIEERAAAPKQAARDPEAHQDYLRGRFFLNKLTEEDLHKAVAHFESAVAQDRGCALAYAGLAEAYGMFAILNMLPASVAGSRARQMAAAALRVAPDLAEAHSACASVKALFERDWDGAQACHMQALQLNPASAIVRHNYGHYLAAAGRAQEASAQLEQARAIEPLSLAIHAGIAWSLYVGRDFARAAEESWKALALDARFAAAQHTLGLAYAQIGMTEEAIVEQRNARVCTGGSPAVLAALVHAYATAQQPEQAAEALRELRALSEKRYVSPYWYAIAYAGLRDDPAALDALEQACQERDVWLMWANVEPRFDHLRTHPRFRTLLRAIGF